MTTRPGFATLVSALTCAALSASAGGCNTSGGDDGGVGAGTEGDTDAGVGVEARPDADADAGAEHDHDADDDADDAADDDDADADAGDDADTDADDAADDDDADADAGDDADTDADDAADDDDDADADAGDDADGDADDEQPCGPIAADDSLPAGVIKLADIGHAGSVEVVGISAERILARDTQWWILWNRADRSQVAHGPLPRGCPVSWPTWCPCSDPRDRWCTAVAFQVGDSFLVQEGSALALYAMADGSRRGAIDAAVATVGPAADGSYVWTASRTSLAAWSTTGTRLVERAGDYSHAVVVGVAGELRVALGPAGRDVIERVDLATGSATVSSPFVGDFMSWFHDGGRFFAGLDSTLEIYSATVVREELLPGLADSDAYWEWEGCADYYWKPDYSYGSGGLHRVGPLPVPPLPDAMWRFVGCGASGPVGASTLTHCDAWERSLTEELRLAVPDAAGFLVRLLELCAPDLNAVAADATGDWAVGNRQGQLFDEGSLGFPGGPHSFGCGAVVDVAGADDGTAAIAVAQGRVLLLEHRADGPRVRGALETGDCRTRIALTPDGATLGLLSSRCGRVPTSDGGHTWPPDRFRLVALPEAIETLLMPYDAYGGYDSHPAPSDFAITADATRSAEADDETHRIVDLTERSVVESRRACTSVPARFSPSGSLVALPSNGTYSEPITETERARATIRVYDHGLLVGARDGFPLLWLDDEHLLVQRYDADGTFLETLACEPDGVACETLPLPEMGLASLVPGFPGRLFSGWNATIYDLETGEVVWTSSVEGVSWATLAGDYVVSVAGTSLIGEEY
jgi:hypothetical protein